MERKLTGPALADAEWDRTAWHIAGTAVALVVQGLPVSGASIRWERAEREGNWLVAAGEIRLTENGGCPVSCPDTVTADKSVIAALAGRAAEIWQVAWASGRPEAEVRAGIEAADGDQFAGISGVASAVVHARISREEAEQRASDLITRWWDQICVVALLLQDNQTLTAAEIAAVTGPCR